MQGRGDKVEIYYGNVESLEKGFFIAWLRKVEYTHNENMNVVVLLETGEIREVSANVVRFRDN